MAYMIGATKMLVFFQKKNHLFKKDLHFFNYQNLLQMTKYIHYHCDFVLNSCSLNCFDLSKTLGMMNVWVRLLF